MDIIAIIGNTNTGKSLTIKELTGASRSGPRSIPYINGSQHTYVQIPALQESEMYAKDFFTEVNKHNVSIVIVTLRTNGTTKHGNLFPDAATYLDEFKNYGWNIIGVAELVKGARLTPTPNLARYTPIVISNVLSQPVKVNAQRLKSAWGIL
ncbi:MAG: hypothetical protein HQK88_13355 [Nitrospirae bacterium]|nr:hypothetical protein [Nitrospirota bacterium]MBF0535878.1 hypothetical protein [Nitrospirota bacterium]MBF0617789.1 hypothetical protein [Nitrospirota bacterium]